MFLAPIPLPKLKSPDKIQNSTIEKKFPVKFWRLVNSCKSAAVCWGLGGNTIRILKERFEEEYLLGENRPFKTGSFSSFIRQLNLYGFRKVIRPVITNEHGQKLNTSLIEYKHPMFLKGHPELLPHIKRNTKSLKTDTSGRNDRLVINNVFLKRKFDDKENSEVCMQPAAKECRIEVGPILCSAAKKQITSGVLKPLTNLATCQLPLSGVHGAESQQQQTMRMSLKAAENLGLVRTVQQNTQLAAGQPSSTVPAASAQAAQSKEGSFTTGLDLNSRDGLMNTVPKPKGFLQIGHGPAGSVTTQCNVDTVEETSRTLLHVGQAGPEHGAISVNMMSQTASVNKPQAVTLVRGTNNGQSVMYLKPDQRKPLQVSTQPQPVVVYNIPKPAPKPTPPVTSLSLSATCEEVASHPLLQPVRRDVDKNKVPGYSRAISRSKLMSLNDRAYLPSRFFTCLPSIPETESSPAAAESAPSQKELADLMLFNLSASLKDIENQNSAVSAPQDGCIAVDVTVETQQDEMVVKTESVDDHTPETVPQNLCNVDNQSVDYQTQDSPDASSLKLGECSSGPRRELFKDKKSNRITIPLSGLPKEIFLPGSDLYKTDTKEAVVTIETSEDGKVTGHLIFPRKKQI